MRNHLPKVSLVAVSSVNIDEHVEALRYSFKSIQFARVMLFSDRRPSESSDWLEVVLVPKMRDVNEWGQFVVFGLGEHIDTDYVLLVHADGFVVNPDAWSPDFLKYDYVGAPWPLPRDSTSFRDYNGRVVRVGNSVSIRSKRLLDYPKQKEIPWQDTDGYFHEDGFICGKIRHLLEADGLSFAPFEVACRFSRELPLKENIAIKPFAFHKWKGPNRSYPRFGRYRESRLQRLVRKVRKTIDY